MNTTVCITGASGYVGSYVTQACLQKGWIVHATVRNPDKAEAVDHLKALPAQLGVPESSLRLFAADLMKPGSYDEAVKGCTYAFHVAASLKLHADDPQKEIIDVGVKGTQNFLESCAKCPDTLKRVVMTSSIAAVCSWKELTWTNGKPNLTFDESHYNDDPEAGPYLREKYLSEVLARDFCEKQPFDIVFINPSLVIGPVMSRHHLNSSPRVIYEMGRGSFRMAPNFTFNICHILDVADAHVKAAEAANPHNRYIISDAGYMSIFDMARVMRTAHPELSLPSITMPYPLAWLLSWFHKDLAVLLGSIGQPMLFSNERMRELLGSVRSADAALVDCINCLVDNNMLDV